MSDEPTEAERLLRALQGVTWEGEPVSAAVERIIAQARREGAIKALDEAADDWLRIPPATTDGPFARWLRARAATLRGDA